MTYQDIDEKKVKNVFGCFELSRNFKTTKSEKKLENDCTEVLRNFASSKVTVLLYKHAAIFNFMSVSSGEEPAE